LARRVSANSFRALLATPAEWKFDDGTGFFDLGELFKNRSKDQTLLFWLVRLSNWITGWKAQVTGSGNIGVL
jgi:hypothetical protein